MQLLCGRRFWKSVLLPFLFSFLSFSLSFLLLFPFFSLSFFPSLSLEQYCTSTVEQQQEEKTQSSCRTAQVTLQSLEGAFNKAVVAVTPPSDKATNYKYLAASNVLK
jgi:hypothetical protein